MGISCNNLHEKQGGNLSCLEACQPWRGAKQKKMNRSNRKAAHHAGNLHGERHFAALFTNMRPARKQKNPTISNMKSLDLWSEWRESNSRPLEPHCAPLADTLVKTAHTIRYITNFRIHFFILFRLMSRRFIPFMVKLWSNEPDK